MDVSLVHAWLASYHGDLQRVGSREVFRREWNLQEVPRAERGLGVSGRVMHGALWLSWRQTAASRGECCSEDS